jgi:serine/threonine protein phosphatase PrpC
MLIPTLHENLIQDPSLDPTKSIADCFETIDIAISSKQKPLILGGTTASVVVISPSGIATMGWTGDSTIVWQINDKVTKTKDHHPLSQQENARLTAGNYAISEPETIEYGKIDFDGENFVCVEEKKQIARLEISKLMVSRSLGNADSKARGLISIPEVFTTEETTEILIIASDGLWDVITERAAIRLVQIKIAEQMRQGQTINVDKIASELVQKTKQIWKKLYAVGQEDDIAIVILVLQPAET